MAAVLAWRAVPPGGAIKPASWRGRKGRQAAQGGLDRRSKEVRCRGVGPDVFHEVGLVHGRHPHRHLVGHKAIQLGRRKLELKPSRKASACEGMEVRPAAVLPAKERLDAVLGRPGGDAFNAGDVDGGR